MTQGQTTNSIPQWQESAKYWAKHCETIREMFMPLTSALIEDARVVEGQSVLDVAGGPGEPSLTIAETVGPTGSVACTDAVAEMVETAKSEAVKRGISNIEFRQCTADILPFDDHSFGVAVSRLGAMFFPDALVALREILRVVRPGGSLAFVVWYKSEFNPFTSVPTDVVAAHVESPPPDPTALGAFRFAELGKLAGILKEAGAIDVKERVFKFDIAAAISPEEFWEMRSGTSDTLRTKLATLSGEERQQIAAEVSQAVERFFPNNRMRFPAQMIIVSGKKPN